MNDEQLKELLGKVTQGEWEFGCERGADVIRMNWIIEMSNETYYPWNPDNLNDWQLFSMSKSLARKVLAAEKVVHEVRAMMNAYHSGKDIYGWADAVSEAIETWEALK